MCKEQEWKKRVAGIPRAQIRDVFVSRVAQGAAGAEPLGPERGRTGPRVGPEGGHGRNITSCGDRTWDGEQGRIGNGVLKGSSGRSATLLYVSNTHACA